MYIYYNMLQERYREYKTAGKLLQRLWMDFTDDGTCEHTFYVEEEVEPNMKWRWIKVARPTKEDIQAVRATGKHIKRKVFFCPYLFEGWQTSGNDIHIWWTDETTH